MRWIFGVYHSKLQKPKWLPSNHLKFDILLAACLIPTEMKFNRCTLCNVPFVYPLTLSYEGAGFVGSVTHGGVHWRSGPSTKPHVTEHITV